MDPGRGGWAGRGGGALGAPAGLGRRSWGRAGGRAGRLGLAAAREALRRVQLHRLPPPHLALLPVGVGLQPLQHGQALRQALGGREQDVVVEEGAQDGADQGSDPEDLRGERRALGAGAGARGAGRGACSSPAAGADGASRGYKVRVL